MAHPKTHVLAMEIPINDPAKMEEFQQVMSAIQEAQVAHQQDLATKFGISDDAAGAIDYLRSRSRWRQSAEDFIIGCDRAGKKYPFLMADFDETAVRIGDMPDGNGQMSEEETRALGL